MTEPLLLFAGGVIAGFLNVVAGGGSLITMPLLMLIGLPETSANGTARLAILVQNLSGLVRYQRDGAVPWRAAAAAIPVVLVGAIAGGNATRLATIPGIGKKTAERMIVELKDKMAEIAAELPERAASTEDDLLPALVTLGYRRNEAEHALAAAREENPDADFQQLLRFSLKRLSRT